MSIQIECPNCKKPAQVPDSAVGKTAKCNCGTSFTVAMSPLLPQNPTMNAKPSNKQFITLGIGISILVAIVVGIVLAVGTIVFLISRNSQDPASNFKQFAKAFVAKAQTMEGIKNQNSGDSRMSTITYRPSENMPYEIDVQKTSSLVTPYSGELRFCARTLTNGGGPIGCHMVRFTFGWQDGKWILLTAEWQDIDGTYMIYGVSPREEPNEKEYFTKVYNAIKVQ